MISLGYYIARTVSRPFEAVIADLTARLTAHGFGLLTDIDVQATLKTKIGADMPKYRILGASMERTASPALKATAEEVRRLLSVSLAEVEE